MTEPIHQQRTDAQQPMPDALEAMNRGIVEAAKWYKFKGLKMVVNRGQGPIEIDPEEVLRMHAEREAEAHTPRRGTG